MIKIKMMKLGGMIWISLKKLGKMLVSAMSIIKERWCNITTCMARSNVSE